MKKLPGKHNRLFTDFNERLALNSLLPKKGEKITDVCGGYGRLTNEYLNKFKEVCLFDNALDLLDHAKSIYGDKIKIVQGSVYEMPFKSNEFDVLILIRASHFLINFNKAVKEISRILINGGIAIIEINNKRNFLEIIRWLFSRSKLHPFSFKTEKQHKNGVLWYHPNCVEQIFQENNLYVKRVLAVFKQRCLLSKKILEIPLFIKLIQILQIIFGLIKYNSSLFYLLEKRN